MADVESPTAIELFHADSKPAGVWYCSQCRNVYGTEEAAQGCHGALLCACGEPRDRSYPNCQECRNKEWAATLKAKEAARFEAAAKVPESEYKDAQVFDECSGDYFNSFDELREHYEADGDPLPAYAWACRDIGVREADIGMIIEPILDEMWEDADVDDLYGVDELDAAVSAFNEANKGVHVWEPDYTRAIILEVVNG